MKKAIIVGSGGIMRSVMARGAENGIDSQNAYSAVLLDQGDYKLNIHSWNIYDETEGWQIHGELEILVTDSPPIVKANACIEIGLIEIPSTELGQPAELQQRYDCITAIASNLDKSWSLAFVDQHLFGEEATVELDAEDNDVVNESWQRDASKAKAQCDPGSIDGTVTCDIVVPFYRNFETIDQKNRDVQLSAKDDQNKAFGVTGWLELLNQQ